MNTDKQLPVIERNFHILNDDRFIMEKISLPVEQQEGEDIHAALNRTRETIVQNFKAAYPKVYTHLNFDEVIDYRNDIRNIPNNPVPNDVKIIEHENYTQFISQSDEKINKGTIEEQIQACTTLEELKSWRILALSTEKILPIYEAKYDELNLKSISIKDK